MFEESLMGSCFCEFASSFVINVYRGKLLRVLVLRDQGKFSETERLIERIQAIQAKLPPSAVDALHFRGNMLHGQTAYGQVISIETVVVGCIELVVVGIHVCHEAANRHKCTEGEPLFERPNAVVRVKSSGRGMHPSLAGESHQYICVLSIWQCSQRPRDVVRELGEDQQTLPEDYLSCTSVDGSILFLVDRSLTQAKYALAESSIERAEAVRVKALGPEHPLVAKSLHSRANLLMTQVRARHGTSCTY